MVAIELCYKCMHAPITTTSIQYVVDTICCRSGKKNCNNTNLLQFDLGQFSQSSSIFFCSEINFRNRIPNYMHACCFATLSKRVAGLAIYQRSPYLPAPNMRTMRG